MNEKEANVSLGTKYNAALRENAAPLRRTIGPPQPICAYK